MFNLFKEEAQPAGWRYVEAHAADAEGWASEISGQLTRSALRETVRFNSKLQVVSWFTEDEGSERLMRNALFNQEKMPEGQTFRVGLMQYEKLLVNGVPNVDFDWQKWRELHETEAELSTNPPVPFVDVTYIKRASEDQERVKEALQNIAAAEVAASEERAVLLGHVQKTRAGVVDGQQKKIEEWQVNTELLEGVCSYIRKYYRFFLDGKPTWASEVSGLAAATYNSDLVHLNSWNEYKNEYLYFHEQYAKDAENTGRFASMLDCAERHTEYMKPPKQVSSLSPFSLPTTIGTDAFGQPALSLDNLPPLPPKSTPTPSDEEGGEEEEEGGKKEGTPSVLKAYVKLQVLLRNRLSVDMLALERDRTLGKMTPENRIRFKLIEERNEQISQFIEQLGDFYDVLGATPFTQVSDFIKGETDKGEIPETHAIVNYALSAFTIQGKNTPTDSTTQGKKVLNTLNSIRALQAGLNEFYSVAAIKPSSSASKSTTGSKKKK